MTSLKEFNDLKNPSAYSHFVVEVGIDDFDYVGSGLMAKGSLQGFEIAGSDSVFYPAIAKIMDDKVRVASRKVKNPKHVRYGWKNYFEATLFNAEGLPASSFQTP